MKKTRNKCVTNDNTLIKVVNPCSAEVELFRENYIYTPTTVALAPYATWSAADMASVNMTECRTPWERASNIYIVSVSGIMEILGCFVFP